MKTHDGTGTVTWKSLTKYRLQKNWALAKTQQAVTSIFAARGGDMRNTFSASAHIALPVIGSSKKLLTLLSVRERRQAALLLVLMAVMAILEALGIAAIMPFLAVLGNPELVNSNPYLALVYEALGFSSDSDFLFFLGLSALVVVVAATLFRTLSHYAISRFTQM